MQDKRFVAPTLLAFAILGFIGGLLSFGIFGFAPFSIVLTTPILCALIGVVAAPRRFWWLVAAALVPLAGMLNGALAVLFEFGIHTHRDSYVGLEDGAVLGFFSSLPFLPALLVAGWMARSLRSARPKSLVAGIYARRFPLTIAFITTTAASFMVRRSNMGASIVALVASGALLVMLFVGVRSLMALLRVQEAMRIAAFLRPAQPQTSGQRDDAYLDLGVGDAQYVYVDPATLLRGAPTATLLLEGDPERSLPIARNAVVLSVLGSLFSLAVFIAAAERALHVFFR